MSSGMIFKNIMHQHGWLFKNHFLKINYEETYYRRFLHGPRCGLCAGTSWSAANTTSTSGSTGAATTATTPLIMIKY
jgi:uncharacterized membrane protein